jgi:hypothetical protein
VSNGSRISHLDNEGLKLAERRVDARLDPGARDHGSDVSGHVAPGRVEDEAIDWFVEGRRGQECEDDEEAADDREARCHSLGGLDGIELGRGKRHGGESGADSRDDSREDSRDAGNEVVKLRSVVPVGASW